MKSPAFQFYVNDFIGSAKVGMMDVDEIGVYVLLLCLDWQEVGFVYDVKRLAKWCRVSPKAFTAAWEQVGECFYERDGRHWNPRLEKEREKQDAWREKSAKGAATANENRRHRAQGGAQGGEEMASAKGSPNGRTSLPSLTPTPSLTQQQTHTPSAAESSLASQYPDQMPDFASFLDRRDPADRDLWAKELLSMSAQYGGPHMAQVALDGAMAKVSSPKALRIFAADAKREPRAMPPQRSAGFQRPANDYSAIDNEASQRRLDRELGPERPDAD